MRAVQLVEFAGPDGLRLVEIDEPAAAGGVVVDLFAAGVAFPDLLQTRAGYQLVRELPAVLGLEGAGVVRSAPPHCRELVGRRVAVFATGGTWQETVVVEPHSVFPLHDETSFAAGAGSLLNYLTAHFVLAERAHARVGETVLIHGASGGVGVAAVHVGRALGLTTIAVVSSPDKARVARAAGAAHVLLDSEFVDASLELTHGLGVDIVLDPVGGRRFSESLHSVGPGGRVVVVGFASGDIPIVPVDVLGSRNISIVGAGWAEFARHDPSYPMRQWDALGSLVRRGALTMVEPTVHPLGEAAEVLRRLGERTSVGKSVLAIRDK